MGPLDLRRLRRSRWLAGLALALVLGGALILTRSLWLPLPARALVVQDRPRKAALLFVLSGHLIWRAPLAARLYREGYAPRVLVTGSGYSDYFLLLSGESLTDAEVAGRVLARLGVDPGAMVLVKAGGTSTYEEALILREYVDAHAVGSVLVVTSNFHSRRARWIFRKVLGPRPVDLVFVEAETTFSPGDWWRREEGLITVANEYTKLAYYVLRY